MKRNLTYNDYFNKIYGALLGKTVIGTLGAPFEGIKMPLNLHFSEEMINTMLPNDDLDLQVLWLDIVERHGPSFTSLDLLKIFCERCPYDPGEYAILRKNYMRGIYPPLSGKFSNDFYINGMGSPIRSEIWACLAPLTPALAAEYAERDAILDHEGDSVYAEQFFAALEAESFFEDDLYRLIELGLKYVPEESKIYRLITDTVDFVEKYGDMTVVLRKILFKYGHPDCTNLYENIGITIAALLLGEGDMIKTGMLALNAGFDTDCTCATAGAVLGFILGADAIIEKYGWSDIRYELGVNLTRRSDTVYDLAEDIALLGAYLNPEISDSPKKEFNFTPSAYPLRYEIKYENDDPTVYPGHDCKAYIHLTNLSNKELKTELALTGEFFSEKIDVSIKSDETKIYPITVSLPSNLELISDKNLINASYDYLGGKISFSFGVIGAMPWKVIGPIWRTDPICTTEKLIKADLKYRNILNEIEYDGCRSDISRRFHLNFAIDTDTEYMTEEECFTPYDENRVDTKYEETVFYQKEDTIRLTDVMGFKGPAVIYFAREVICENDRTVCMQIGHSSPFSLMLNGKVIAERKACDTWDAENVHLEGIELKTGVNRLLVRLTQVNDDTKFNVFFSNRRSCGEHYVDLKAKRPELF